MTRGLTAGMETQSQAAQNIPVWIIRLDIETDPVYWWTGAGDYSPVGTGDAALDGNTFTGLGNIEEITPIEDSSKGSSAVRLVLPGVNLTDTALQEIILDSRKWQRRSAWIWLGYLDTDLGVIDFPTRLKTGRMDQIIISSNGPEGTVTVIVESHQANISQAQDTRQIDQKALDPTDTSQDFIFDLVDRKAGTAKPKKIPPGIAALDDRSDFGIISTAATGRARRSRLPPSLRTR